MPQIKELDEMKLGVLEQSVKAKAITAPLGFIPIELSTNGNLGVPKVVNCRNFSTSDLVELSLFNTEMLPERVVPVVNSLIYEDVDVSTWPDKCIIELLVKLYVNFFTPILNGINFPWNDTDIEFLRSKGRDAEADSLINRKWKPKIDLDLTTVKVNTLTDDVKSKISIKKKDKNGSVILDAKFIAYPRYGDVIMIRKAVEKKFEETDKKFERIKQLYELKERYIEEDRDISVLEPISDADYLRWQTYEAKKTVYMAKASQALYLVFYNGRDLSEATLDEKIGIMESPQFDVGISKQLEKHYESLNFGVDPNVKVMNPITKEPSTRRFSFRVVDIVQAIRASDSNEYDISYDD